MGAPSAKQCRQHDGVRVAGLDLGQLGLEIDVAFGEGLGRGDRNLQVFERLLEVVVAALGEHVVVAVHHRHLLDVGVLDGYPQGLGQHVGFGHRIAEHVVANRGDAVGRVGGAKGHGLGGLGDRVGRLGRVRQRGAEHHQDLVLEDQFLEDVDGFFFLALFVFDDQLQLVAIDAARGIDLIGSELEAVADGNAVLRGAARQGLGHTDFDVGGVGAGAKAGGKRQREERICESFLSHFKILYECRLKG